MTQLTPIDLGTRADVDLADVRLRPSQRELAGPGGIAVLEPRVMQVLLALADADGGVVSRDRLMALCWGGAVVGDDALNRAIAGARKALRDAGSTRLAVLTIPRVGYRLEQAPAPAETADGPALDNAVLTREAEAPEAAEGALPEAPPRSDRRRVLAGALGLTALAAVGGWTALRSRRDPRAQEVNALIAQADQAMRLALAESDRQGIGFLRHAVELAPENPRPWGRLALALRTASEYAAPASMRALRSESEAAAKRALQLDDDNADARITLATLLPTYGNWLSIERAVRDVFDAHPDHVPTIDALSFVWASAGLVRAHYPLRLRTVELDPFHAAYNFRSIYAHWMNGRLADADRAGARGLELWPRHAPTWLARVGVFGMTSRADRAVAMIDDAASRPDLPPPLLASLRRSHVALASGRADERAATIESLLQEVAGGGPLVAVNAALLLATFGAVEPALDVVEAYLLERGPVMAGTAWQPGQLLHYDVRGRLTQFLFLPVMAPLHSHARFAAMMRDCGLAAFWRASGRRPDYLGEASPP